MKNNHTSFWLENDGERIGMIDVTLFDDNVIESSDKMGEMLDSRLAFTDIRARKGNMLIGDNNE